MKNDSWGPGQNGGALSVADGDEQRFFFSFFFLFVECLHCRAVLGLFRVGSFKRFSFPLSF